MSEQLTLFGASNTQEHFSSETWGLLTFYPSGNDKWTDNCRLCLLYRSQECEQAPCCAEERSDGERGYFSIHDMPKIK